MFSTWVIDHRRMSWLNSAAQSKVTSIAADIRNQIASMERQAKSYFQGSGDLNVDPNIINYFALLNTISIPTVKPQYTGQFSNGGASTDIEFGIVDVGMIEDTIERPFSAVVGVEDGSENGVSESLYWGMDEFEQWVNNFLIVNYPPMAGLFDNFSKAGFWKSLKLASTQRRIGFYFRFAGPGHSHAIAIKDASGAIIDETDWRNIIPVEVGSSGLGRAQADLNLTVASSSGIAILGRKQTLTLAVTNQGPGTAYGVNLRVPLASSEVEAVEFSGVQGSGVYTNDVVTYSLGPIAVGSSASATFQFVPIQTNISAILSTTELGSGLTDPNPTNNSVALPAILAELPIISAKTSGLRLELDWLSDTDRLVVEHAPRLGPAASWTTVTNQYSTTGSQRSMQLPTTATQQYFRLNVK